MLFRLLRRRFKAAYDEKKEGESRCFNAPTKALLEPQQGQGEARKGVHQLNMYNISFTIFSIY